MSKRDNRKGRRDSRPEGGLVPSAKPGPTEIRGMRADQPPENDLDARERSEALRMNSDDDAQRYNSLEWHALWRWVITLAALTGFMAAVVFLARVADDPEVVAILVGSALGTAGYAIRSLLLSRSRGGPSGR